MSGRIAQCIRCVFSVLLVCVTCTGCWDANEIDDLAIVSASGWDAEGPNITATLQIARPSELGATSGGGGSGNTGSTETFALEQGTGPDPMGALEEARQKLSRTMLLSHREVLVLGENFARKQGVASLIDEVVRNPQSRLRTDIVVAYHGKAQDVLQLPYSLNRLPASAIRGMEDIGTIPRIDARQFVKDLNGQGDPYAVGVEPIRTLSEKEPYTFRLDHVAVFKADKLVGWLEGHEVNGFLWIIGGSHSTNTPILIPGKGYVGLKLLDMHSNVRATMVNGRPGISISVQVMDDIIENDTNLDFNSQSSIDRVRHTAEKSIRRDVQATVHRLQHDYHADICSFGERLYQRYPDLYVTRLKPHWDRTFETLPVIVKVDVRVQRSGLTVHAMK